MDPIGSSCPSLVNPDRKNSYNAAQEKYKDTKDEALKAMIDSCRTLSKYEGKTLRSLFPQIFASLLAASFHIGNGISLAYSAILISQLQEKNSPIKPTDNECAWMASVLIVIAPPASIIGGLIMDHLGRLNCIKIASLPGIIGWCMIALAQDVPMIIFGRLFVGISSAWGTSPGIVYITEIASSNLRMSLMAIAPTYVALGMVFTYLGGWYLHWKTLAWICNIFIIIPSLVCLMLHESPSWLILKEKYDRAKESLYWIHKYQKVPGEIIPYAEIKYKELQEEQLKKRTELASRKYTGMKLIFHEFSKSTGWKPLIILTGLFFFQHFSGIYITMFYSISFIKAAKTDINAYLASIMIGLVRLVMSIASIFILKKFPRRYLIFVSTIFMATCMLISGLWTKYIEEEKTELKWIPAVALLFYVIASTIGLLPIPNMLMAELYPLEIRGIGYSVTYSVCCILMFIALQCYYIMSELFGGAANLQWFFASVCLGGLVYTYIFIPETCHLKLNEISEYFKTRFIYIGHKNTNNNNKKSMKRSDISDNSDVEEQQQSMLDSHEKNNKIEEV